MPLSFLCLLGGCCLALLRPCFVLGGLPPAATSSRFPPSHLVGGERDQERTGRRVAQRTYRNAPGCALRTRHDRRRRRPEYRPADHGDADPSRPDGEVDYGSEPLALLAANMNQLQRLLARQAAYRPSTCYPCWPRRSTSHPCRAPSLSCPRGCPSPGASTATAQLVRESCRRSPARPRGLLLALTGWHIVFSGLGNTAGTSLRRYSHSKPDCSLHYGHLPRRGRRVVRYQ